MTYLLPGTLAMGAIVLASNILVQFLFGPWLTWGAFTYPLAFLVTDMVNLVHGPRAARRVVLAGFVVGLLCSLVGSQIMGEAGPLVTLRVALASGVAFLVAQLLDVTLFDRLRNGVWWRAPLASSLVGSTLDTLLFFFIALGTGGSDVSGISGEPTGTGYARQVVTFFGTGLQYSLSQARFTFTSAPGTITHVGVFDALTAGNPLLWAPLPTPAILNGPGIINIPVNSLSIFGD